MIHLEKNQTEKVSAPPLLLKRPTPAPYSTPFFNFSDSPPPLRGRKSKFPSPLLCKGGRWGPKYEI